MRIYTVFVTVTSCPGIMGFRYSRIKRTGKYSVENADSAMRSAEAIYREHELCTLRARGRRRVGEKKKPTT